MRHLLERRQIETDKLFGFVVGALLKSHPSVGRMVRWARGFGLLHFGIKDVIPGVLVVEQAKASLIETEACEVGPYVLHAVDWARIPVVPSSGNVVRVLFVSIDPVGSVG